MVRYIQLYINNFDKDQEKANEINKDDEQVELTMIILLGVYSFYYRENK